MGSFFVVVVAVWCVCVRERERVKIFVNFLQLFGQLSFLEGGGSNMSRLLCLKNCPLLKEGKRQVHQQWYRELW